MNNQKGFSKIWIVVVLANIGVYLALIMVEVYGARASAFSALFAPITDIQSIITLCTSFFGSVIPVWLSGSRIERRDQFGFGIPILLLLPTIFFTWILFYSCDGYGCVGAAAIAYTLGLFSACFFFFYTVSFFLRKGNTSIALFLIFAELVFLVGATLFLGYYGREDLSLASLESGKKIDFAKIDEMCSRGAKRKSEDNCWMAVLKGNPGVDVCSWAKKESSKQICQLNRMILDIDKETFYPLVSD